MICAGALAARARATACGAAGGWSCGGRGRITFVASTARGHRSRRLAPRRAPHARGRRIARGIHRRGRLVYGVRRGKVRFVGASRDRRALFLRRIRAAF
jgi:hypothetical protein